MKKVKVFFAPPQTHNQDQCWGIISRRVAHESTLQNDADVISVIQDELSKPTLKDWLGSQTRLAVRKLDGTHDWLSHLPGLVKVKLKGGLLKDDTGNHLFLALQRRGSQLEQTLKVFFCLVVWWQEYFLVVNFF